MWDSGRFRQRRGPRLAGCLAMLLIEIRLDDRPRHVLRQSRDGLIDRDLDVFDQPRDRAFRIIVQEQEPSANSNQATHTGASPYTLDAPPNWRSTDYPRVRRWIALTHAHACWRRRLCSMPPLCGLPFIAPP